MSPMTTDAPDDLTLTSDGLDATGQGHVLLLACGALAREIIDIKQRNGWSHMDISCLPAILHNHPEKITDAVRDAIGKHSDRYDQIFVVYADCGTGGLLQAACQELGVKMVEGPHCYAFFDGVQQFADRDEITSFFLTDFLVRQFDAFVWKPLGLDRHPQLRGMYFEHYEKLVYLAQTDDPDLTSKAERQAERLGLTFERRLTGYGDLEKTMADWATQARPPAEG